MRYEELTAMVTGSSAEDWVLVGRGPLYLDRFTDVLSQGDHWTESDSPNYLAIYKPDVSLRIAWGLELDDKLSFEDWAWPDPGISRFAADVFWQGALAARWTLLLVDGARSYLPDPQRAGAGSGWTAKASEIAFARLLQELVRRPAGEFDRYLQSAGIAEVPG
jgi:hypothetical protein